MNRLNKKYQQEIVDKLKKEFSLSNPMSVSKVKKIVINTGISEPDNIGERMKVIKNVGQQLATITGQKPRITRSKKAISNFNLRAGDPLGVAVTLRGKKMWQFLDKLISVALPRVKDFRGVSRSAFDGHGNYSLGLQEQIIFPEIDYDEIDSVRSFQVNIVTSTDQDKKAFRLLELLGMPFAKEEK